MISEQWLNLFVFSLTGAMTPGPNNLMLAASGLRYGFKRTLPHMSGIPLGFTLVQIFSALGVGTLIATAPWLQTVMAFLAAGYMLYLMSTLNLSVVNSSEIQTGKPLQFYQSASFQLINPKAWIMTVSAAAIYLQGDSWTYRDVMVICLTFFAISLLSMSSWTLIGTAMQSALAKPRSQLIFRIVFYAMTLYVAISLIWDSLYRLVFHA